MRARKRLRSLGPGPAVSFDGIEKYRDSGMIRGIGLVYAKKLVPPSARPFVTKTHITGDRIGQKLHAAASRTRSAIFGRSGR